ncbi:transposase [Levilactobacillus yonginensis]
MFFACTQKPVSNIPIEGINHRIKQIMHTVLGYRNWMNCNC